MERRIKKKYASFIQFFFFFFQYRAIRIKTGKGINPVRINKTLVLVRSFHFSPSITPGFPARNGHRIDSHFRASSLIPSTMHIVIAKHWARRDVGKMGGYAPPDKDTPGCRTFCERVSCIYIAAILLLVYPLALETVSRESITLVMHKSADRST